MEWTQPAIGRPTTVQNQPQPKGQAPAAATTASVAASNAKKRSLEENTLLRDSPYFKMRAIVRDLRPHFMEVLQTPDFRKCKGAEEIREKMNIFMELYKEMMGETKDNNASKNMYQDMKKPSPTEQVFSRPSTAENKRCFTGTTGSVSRNLQTGELGGGRLDGTSTTYIVGGSAFGWNFVTYPGTKSVYYGRTKEAFRAAIACIKSQ